MNKSRRLASLALIGFVLSLLGACSYNRGIEPKENKKTVALILNSGTGYHGSTIKLGADIAAREFNINLEYNAPLDDGDTESQIKMVEQALAAGVDGLILAAGDFKDLVEVTEKAYAMNIPVIIIDSAVDTTKIDSYIATDNLEAGIKAAEAVVSKVGSHCQTVILSYLEGSRNAEKREEGFMSIISEYPGIEVLDTKYTSSEGKLAYELTQKILTEHPDLDVIVALNTINTEYAAQAVDEMGLGGKVKIIGFGSTTREIAYMERDVIQALIIQNPFSMGYLGVKYAADRMAGKAVEKQTYTESKMIDYESIYLPENQKLIFPLIK
jgi:ribose transport system substrate-binding protein